MLPTKRVEKAEKALLFNFAPIFYTCKLFGIYPHDFEAFRAHKILQSSRVGSMTVIAVLIFIVTCYIVMAFAFRKSTILLASVSMVGQLVNACLTFSGPLIMAVDQLNAIIKQKHLSEIFVQIDQLDARMQKLEIVKFNNFKVKICIRVMLTLAILFEASIFGGILYYYVDHNKWTSLLWIFVSIPTLYNAFDKIWFIGLTVALKNRFAAINLALETIVEEHEHMNKVKENLLAKEIVPFRYQVPKTNSIPSVTSLKDYLKEDFMLTQKELKSKAIKITSELNDDYEAIEEKFMLFCQLHNDICDIIKKINKHWSWPILGLMAFGFVTIIAQFYFMYQASWDESIPALYISAKSVLVTFVYLTYLTGKCVTLVFYCWKTKKEGQRTALCFHRCALAANRNQIYELVNHLSLKLLNHIIDFSAGGFFNLDMSTLFGVLGGLTSYLIIFIQFDLEAKQPQGFHPTTTPTTSLANVTKGGS